MYHLKKSPKKYHRKFLMVLTLQFKQMSTEKSKQLAISAVKLKKA